MERRKRIMKSNKTFIEEKKSQESFQIFLKTLTGRTNIYDIHKDETILSFKYLLLYNLERGSK